MLDGSNLYFSLAYMRLNFMVYRVYVYSYSFILLAFKGYLICLYVFIVYALSRGSMVNFGQSFVHA